jgi:hypothetical protein
MAINRFRFYLGPIGAMVPLPPHKREPSLDATRDIVGQLQESLSGRRTLDVRAFKKTWTLDWDWRLEDELLGLLRGYLGYANAPLRILDPRSRNLLPLNISTCGSELQAIDGFTKTGTGTLTYQADATMPAELQGQLSGEIQLATATTGDVLMGTVETVPLIPYSTYLFTGYVKGSGQWTPAYQPVNAAGVVITTVWQNTLTLTGNWQQFSVSYTSDGTYPQMYFGQRCSASGTVQTTGWQLQIDEYARRPWLPGNGCPEVIVAKLQKKYQGMLRRSGLITPYHTLNATILEV